MKSDQSKLVAARDTPWMDLAPGIQMRLLRVDVPSGHFTMLIHASPGSQLPRHRHEGAAEIYVLKGRGLHPQTG